MDDNKDVNLLNERVKELSCLYQIASIAAKQPDNIASSLTEIVNLLPDAWRFPSQAIAKLVIDNEIYESDEPSFDSISQTAQIIISNRTRGILTVSYSKSKVGQMPFLQEEQQLLNKVASDIAAIIERKDRIKRENEIEKKLKHTDRLAILGEITAGIAHELNTPLANILGFAQFIQKKAQTQQVLKDVEKIIQASIHAREVVKKLMFFSCDMPQYKQIVVLNNLVADALKLLKPMLVEANVKLDFVATSTHIKARLDEVQITQVIFNLVINATHACKTDGRVVIEISEDENSAFIYVRDNGGGIPIVVQPRIFEPFFSTKEIGQGSGLGLSVVHGIVKSHGGEIQFESTIGKGTNFQITLPKHVKNFEIEFSQPDRKEL